MHSTGTRGGPQLRSKTLCRKEIAMKMLFLVTFILLHSAAYAQPLTIFKGSPSVKVSEGGFSRTPEAIDASRAVGLACVVSKIGDEYFWASRENTPLSSIESGAFVTYIALNGSGHIRVIKSDLKEAAALMSETEKNFDYVEHLNVGLRSVIYYGKAQ
ncbi:MAG TPA: hypothetical protein VFY07_00520, partial [Geomobilimonas sp.]|nr:hypothetical protein [Geomobilimonas sp.]